MIQRVRLLSLVALVMSCAFFDPLDQPGLTMRLIPADTALFVGNSLMAGGRMINSYGDTYPSEHIHYVGLDSSVSVTFQGRVTGISYGRARIVAKRDDFVDTGFVSVVPSGTLALTSFSSLDVAGVDGSNYSSIVSTGQGIGDAAAWVPGRDTLVYSYGIPGGAGRSDLYVTDMNGNRRLLASGGRDPRVTSDRQWVYFGGDNVIERIHLDGTGREIVVPTTVFHPDPSPNGTQLVYVHVRRIPPPVEGFGLEIVIRTLSDSTERSLAFDVNDVNRPRWSPDGSRIAFWHADNTGFGAIYTIDVNGANEVQVSQPGRLYRSDALDWSPDGSWILARGQTALELIQVSTGLTLPLSYTDDYLAGSWRR